jgi:acyl dehydratase
MRHLMDDEGPADLSLADLPVGAQFEREYAIEPRLYEGFLALFGDLSPVHVDDAYARASGFEGRVMHGAILNGFLSHFIGMVCPGQRALLLSADIRYAKPSYLGDRIAIRASISQVVESQRVVVLNIEFFNATKTQKVARGRVQVAIRDA